MPLTSARSRSSLIAVQPMPIIAEDDSAPPAIPKRSTARRSLVPSNLRTSYQTYSPFSSFNPAITSPISSDGTLPDRKPEPGQLEYDRHQEWLARRGGWYRLVMGLLVVIGLVVGLAVGLTLGLRKKKSTTTNPLPLSTLFPAGNYTFTTALTNTTTTCTTNPLTFRCYPYTLYSPSSPSQSSTTFFWTIRPVTSYSYVISSTPNPFAPNFTSIPLVLTDANQYTERLSFNFSLSKPSIAGGPLFDGEEETATCWFNTTVMSVTLWTRMRGEYPDGIGGVEAPVNGTGDGGFGVWPFRVDVRQVQMGGRGVPDCRVDGREVQGDGGLGTGQGECGCYYRNYELGGGNGTSTTVMATSSATGAVTETGLRVARATSNGRGGKR